MMSQFLGRDGLRKLINIFRTDINKTQEIQIYDFETADSSIWLNETTFAKRIDEWYPPNKIYKIGRLCWLNLGIDTSAVTENGQVLIIAYMPNEFLPMAIVTRECSNYHIGIYSETGGGYLYVAHRDYEKYPEWSDMTNSGEILRIQFMYFSRE